MDKFVAALDVGTFNNWGIATTASELFKTDDVFERTNLIIEKIAGYLNEGKLYVALGFETPLWIPIASDPQNLLKARSIDGSRPWSAGAGASVTTASLAVVPWWLAEIQKKVNNPKATINPKYWEPGVLLIWEAFVSGSGKTKNDINQHHQDAQDAVNAFCEKIESVQDAENIFGELPFTENNKACEQSIFSLATTFLKFTGWEVRESSCICTHTLVIKS